MGAKVEVKVQTWGSDLAVRIPARIARAARLVSGQRVELEVVDGQIVISLQVGTPRLTLDHMAKAFNRKTHGGEMMAYAPRGREFR